CAWHVCCSSQRTDISPVRFTSGEVGLPECPEPEGESEADATAGSACPKRSRAAASPEARPLIRLRRERAPGPCSLAAYHAPDWPRECQPLSPNQVEAARRTIRSSLSARSWTVSWSTPRPRPAGSG